MDLKSFLALVKGAYTVEAATSILTTLITGPEIEKALQWCIDSHEGVFRKTGEPYSVHPILVASLVAFYGGDEVLVQSALLHDVVEDTKLELKDIETAFGKQVRLIVDGVTKIKEIRKEQLVPSSSDEALFRSAGTFHKMLLRSIDHIGVLVVKLCDRMHNVMTLQGLEPRKQVRVAEETLLVYAPIAHRLGISNMRNYLENQAFLYAHPDSYQYIESYFQRNRVRHQKILDRFKQHLNTLMLERGFNSEPFHIQSSVKHSYSIHKKMQRQKVDVDEVMDLFRVRIFVQDELACYTTLGVIHTNFRPLLDRFKDHISYPKDNGYQSLHGMISFEGMNIEFQIRTFDMHKTAEFGVTAAWKFQRSGLEPCLDWLQKTEKTPERLDEFYQETKADLSVKDIVVSTPNGMAVTLPLGSLALDFAYSIHTDLGNYGTGAFVNGRPASIFKPLRNGDMVRIVVDENKTPRYKGSSRVRTALARRMLDHNSRKRKSEIQRSLVMHALAAYFELPSNLLESLIKSHNIGFDAGRICSEPNLQIDLIKKCQKAFSEVTASKKNRKSRLKLQEVAYFNIRFPQKIKQVHYRQCCHPSWGNDILGISHGRHSLDIHDLFCEKTFADLGKTGHMAFISWLPAERRIFVLRVSLQKNEIGSLAQFLQDLADSNIRIRSLNLQDHPSRVGYCDIKVETDILEVERLQAIVAPHAKLIDIQAETL